MASVEDKLLSIRGQLKNFTEPDSDGTSPLSNNWRFLDSELLYLTPLNVHTCTYIYVRMCAVLLHIRTVIEYKPYVHTCTYVHNKFIEKCAYACVIIIHVHVRIESTLYDA